MFPLGDSYKIADLAIYKLRLLVLPCCRRSKDVIYWSCTRVSYRLWYPLPLQMLPGERAAGVPQISTRDHAARDVQFPLGGFGGLSDQPGCNQIFRTVS